MAQTVTFQQPFNIDNTPIKDILSSQDNKEEEMRQPSSAGDKNNRMKKKRKRKVHKPKPQLDPQEVKEINMQRMNIRREFLWNNRFINETIPDYLEQKSKRKFNLKPNKGKSSVQIYMEKPPKQNTEFEKTKYLHKDVNPKITHKSFKIRHLRQQKHEKKPKSQNGNKTPLDIRMNEGPEQLKQSKQIVKKSTQKRQKSRKKVKKHKEQQPKEHAQTLKSNYQSMEHANTEPKPQTIPKTTTYRQKLQFKLKQKLRLFPISPQYQQMITEIINSSAEKKNKQLRNKLQKQIDSIGTEKHTCKIISTFIEDRRKIIKELIQKGENSPLKLYIDFQIYSLAIIQQLLKYKGKWQDIYQTYLQSKKKVIFYYEGAQYITNMKYEVKQLCGDVMDPFLIKKTNKLHKLVDSSLSNDMIKERKDMVLKLRACQLFLIQEELQCQN